MPPLMHPATATKLLRTYTHLSPSAGAFSTRLYSSTPSTAPKFQPPPGSWDSHIHITHPDFDLNAPSSNPAYKPHAAPLSEAIAHSARHSVPNLVFVQPSTSGLDNKSVLYALSSPELPGIGRGVVALDPKNPPVQSQLEDWHALGVRAIRLNLKSLGKEIHHSHFTSLLRSYGKLLQQLEPTGLRWALQIYADLDILNVIFKVPELRGVKVVVDHLGAPGKRFPKATNWKWMEFLGLLAERGGTWVKASGAYRFGEGLHEDERMERERRMLDELIGIDGGRRVVWASDWPHTRFEDKGVDVAAWMQEVAEACKTEEVRERVFRTNAERLWDAGAKERWWE